LEIFSMGGLSTLLSLGTALYTGETNKVTDLVEHALEEWGHSALHELLPERPREFSEASRAFRDITRAREHFLNQFRPAPLPYSGVLKKLAEQINNAVNIYNQEATKPVEGRHWTYSKSRQQWLDVSHRFDWRTQPRDPHGQWTPGRLRYPYMSKDLKRMRRKLRYTSRKAARRGFRGAD
jgi:hypothetical protein